MQYYVFYYVIQTNFLLRYLDELVEPLLRYSVGVLIGGPLLKNQKDIYILYYTYISTLIRRRKDIKTLMWYWEAGLPVLRHNSRHGNNSRHVIDTVNELAS